MTCDCQFSIADCHADWIAAGGRQYPLERFIYETERLFTEASFFFQGWHMAAHRHAKELNPQLEIRNPKL